MGSANLNDRSQKGDGDSEIALVVEDTEEIESWMHGQQVCLLQTTYRDVPNKMAYSTWRRNSRRPSGASSTEVGSFTLVIKSLFLQYAPEHLGLIPPQNVVDGHDRIDSFMRAAPFPNADETRLREDARVADPLSDELLNLWQDTAKRNRDIFTEVFRPVPSDLVQNWKAYKVRLQFVGYRYPRVCHFVG
jgi:phospholipase D1/2